MKQSSYKKLVFPTLTHLWQVYNIYLSSNTQQVPLIHFHVPWSNEDLYNLITLRDPSSPSSNLPKTLHRHMRLKLHRLPLNSANDQYPSLELYLNPNIDYKLEIQSSFIDILSQLIRYYIFLFPTFLFTVLCVSYYLQTNYTILRTYQTMLAWQIHIPMALLITILYKIFILVFPTSNFVTNIHTNGYYFLLLPLILYFLALSFWAIVSYIIDYVLLDYFHRLLSPLLNYLYNELTQQLQYTYIIQSIILSMPLLSTFLFSGSNGHISLFVTAFLHIIWRGTINRRLREILTTLLLFHSLLVILNLTGFIIHIKSIFIQKFLPLCLIMSDPSFISAICSILTFYLRFLFNRTNFKLIQYIKLIFSKYNHFILIILAISCQFLCSYSMYYLWIYICFIFIHVAVIFFISIHQD